MTEIEQPVPSGEKKLVSRLKVTVTPYVRSSYRYYAHVQSPKQEHTAVRTACVTTESTTKPVFSAIENAKNEAPSRSELWLSLERRRVELMDKL